MKTPKNVLVVDDNQLLANMIADMFRAVNFNVQIANDYEVAAVMAHNCDIAVIDYWLDGKRSGADLTRYIKNHVDLKHIPVIGISGLGKEDIPTAFMKAGADGFLAKPLRNPPLYLYALGIFNKDVFKP